jgi:rhamnose transport system permease protein
VSVVSQAKTGGVDSRRLVTAVVRFREAGILFVLVLLVVITSLGSSQFLTTSNLQGIALDITILTVVAVGETVVILSRNIDISVGSILGFTALFVGVVIKYHPGVPVILFLLLGMGVGLLFGLGNGLLVAVGKVPAIIATLGTYGIIRGLAFMYSSSSGQLEITAANLPQGFLNLATETFLGIPVFEAIPVIALVAAAYWLRQTRSGREVYAVGGNPVAARLAGIHSGRIVLLAFAISGALAGLGGVLYTSRYAQVDPNAGLGLELTVIAAVVIGGTSTLGGKGGMLGTLIGCLLLGVINNSLILLSPAGTAQYWQLAVYGTLFLGAVTLDAFISGRLQKALQRRRHMA